MALLWWLLFIPLIDLILLARMGRLLGGYLYLWILISFVLGCVVIRTGGFRRRSRVGDPAGLTDRLLTTLSGLALIFPGPLTDIFGLVLLLAPVRRLLAARLAAAFIRRTVGGSGWKAPPGSEGSRTDGGGHGQEGPSKTGGSRGQYPGADKARDVDFDETR